MRVLLASTASHVPPRGGATRSNLAWLRALRDAGHECRVVSAAASRDTDGPPAEWRRELEEQALDPALADAGTEVRAIESEGLLILTVEHPYRQRQVLREQIKTFQPDRVLISSEDFTHGLLREAQQDAPGRVVYLAHTPQFFPFGPASWNPDAKGTELVSQAAAVVAIGQHTARYVEQYSGRRPVVLHPPIYGNGPYRNCARFDGGLLSMINPSEVKGLPIFLALAERLPHLRWGVLPGWATTSEHRAALARLPQMELLPHVKQIDDFLCRTRILLMPSLWYEGFGLIVVEAMLRGIPVVASNAGGLVEAKLGTQFVLPVHMIERYEAVFDQRHMPRAVVPEQDLTLWVQAVQELTHSRAAYELASTEAREAASAFVAKVRGEDFVRFLEELPQTQAGAPAVPHGWESLSTAKRELLLQRLRQRQEKPR